MSSKKLTHTEIRLEIKRIREDATLTEEEKRRCFQNVMSPTPGGSPMTNCGTPITTAPLVSNYSKECSHYQKKCSRFVFDCCNVTDPCNRCHLARDCCKTAPPRISSITCDVCEYVQEPSPSCVQCNTQFSKCYCPICKIWTALDIIHCDDCGCCRVGAKDEIFHCHTCDACFDLKFKHVHICSKKPLRHEHCCFCLEQVHNCQEPCVATPCCRIFVHEHCLLEAWNKGNYKCPRCRKSLSNMTDVWEQVRHSIAVQPLPSDMFDYTVGWIFKSIYGPFRITSITTNIRINFGGNPNGNSGGNKTLYSGHLIDWELSDGSYAKATLTSDAMKDKVRMMELWCNDCSKKSVANFHFLGLECRYCKGFNTIKA